MTQPPENPTDPKLNPPQNGVTADAPRQPGPIERQLRLIARLTTKSGQVIRQIMTSPAIRSHVISIIRSEGVFGVIRRLRRMRSNLDRIDRSAASFQARALALPAWIARFDTPSSEDLVHLAQITAPMTISVRVIVGPNAEADLSKTLDSLRQSSITQWYGQIVFTPDVPEHARAAMVAAAKALPQFSEITATTAPDAIILIQAGTILRPHALALLAAQLSQSPKTALLYADEIRTSTHGSEPWFKPDYAPLMARSGRLFGGLVAIQAKTEASETVLQRIATAPDAWETTIVAWANGLSRDAIGHLPHLLSETAASFPPYVDVTPALTAEPVVSIIIPTRNFWSVLKPCLDSLQATDWPKDRLEILVIDNGSDDEATLAGLAERAGRNEIRVIRHDSAFNWSELNNIGASHATGSVLVFLNNDVEVIAPDWLRILVAFACAPENGAVGCKLLYPDRTVQHGGVIIGIQGVAGHAHLFIDETAGGYQGLANISREISAVTGACIAVEKRKFDEVGGFDEGFKVAFNDIAFCVSLTSRGYANIYAANAVLLHHESKSRGYDTTPEKIERNRIETIAFWHKFHIVIRDDKFYSPNLSYRDTYKLSYFPRRKPAWTQLAPRPRVLMLSITHAKGHGVPVVLALQADALVKAGFDVIVAGPQSGNDFPYEGCTFVEVHDPEAAALVALLYRVDCVVAHTPPFFSTVRWLGADFPFVAYDYGEPPPAWFDDADSRRDVNNEKETCLAMADRVYAISNAIRDESKAAFDGVIRLGNSHLGTWTADATARRAAIRERLGFKDRFIILNVCRFQRGERRYKGVNHYVDAMRAFRANHPELAARSTFVLCGKGAPKDVKDMQQEGLSVYPNVTDETMSELYIAADAYMNFSQWEGYNLGIAQALAMGLPTFASDIPAHRAFGIEVSQDMSTACKWLATRVEHAAEERANRQAKLWTWDEPLAEFGAIIKALAPGERS